MNYLKEGNESPKKTCEDSINEDGRNHSKDAVEAENIAKQTIQLNTSGDSRKTLKAPKQKNTHNRDKNKAKKGNNKSSCKKTPISKLVLKIKTLMGVQHEISVRRNTCTVDNLKYKIFLLTRIEPEMQQLSLSGTNRELVSGLLVKDNNVNEETEIILNCKLRSGILGFGDLMVDIDTYCSDIEEVEDELIKNDCFLLFEDLIMKDEQENAPSDDSFTSKSDEEDMDEEDTFDDSNLSEEYSLFSDEEMETQLDDIFDGEESLSESTERIVRSEFSSEEETESNSHVEEVPEMKKSDPSCESFDNRISESTEIKPNDSNIVEDNGDLNSIPYGKDSTNQIEGSEMSFKKTNSNDNQSQQVLLKIGENRHQIKMKVELDCNKEVNSNNGLNETFSNVDEEQSHEIKRERKKRNKKNVEPSKKTMKNGIRKKKKNSEKVHVEDERKTSENIKTKEKMQILKNLLVKKSEKSTVAQLPNLKQQV